ncbi:hypothetical protein GS504_01770 [Rhodococcus hoagii]|nr:hypothetical protein [Prescottella equi]
MTTFGMPIHRPTPVPARTIRAGFCTRSDSDPTLWDNEIDDEEITAAVDRLTDAAVLCAACPVWDLCPRHTDALDQLMELDQKMSPQRGRVALDQLTLPGIDGLESAA